MMRPCIGVFPEEEIAYNRVTTLMWSLPLLVVLSSLLDLLLYFMYQKKCHPWGGILQD